MPSRRRAISALLAAGVSAACWLPESSRRRRGLSLDQIAERYVRLALMLAQHQPSLVEAWLGPDDWRPGPRVPAAEIQREIVEAEAALAGLSVDLGLGDRYRYLKGQLKGLATSSRRLAGESMRFTDEARAAFGVDLLEVIGLELGVIGQQSGLAAAREELDRRLPGRGPLHERHTAFRAQHALAPGRVEPTFRAALDACRDRVLLLIHLPETERVDLYTDTGLGAEATAVYQGDFRTRITLDLSGPIDLARLVWLAAHEAYPGHHVQHVLADRDCVRARGCIERALHPSFGTHLLFAEGAAEAGAALLLDGDVFEEACRKLAPVAGVSARAMADLVAVQRLVTALDIVIPAVVQSYLDGEISSEAAVERLVADALVVDARQFLAVIERQRTRLLAYPIGRRLVHRAVLAGPLEQRWQRLATIATTLIESG